MSEEVKRWLSPPPTHCEICGTPITDKFYDAATKLPDSKVCGPWACMCPNCFNHGEGIGVLGLGRGQEYTWTLVGERHVYAKTGG